MTLYEGVAYIREKRLPNICEYYSHEHAIEFSAIFHCDTGRDDTTLDEVVGYCCDPANKVIVLIVWQIPGLEYGTLSYDTLQKKLKEHRVWLVSVPKNHKWGNPFETMQAEFIPRPLLK